MTKGAALIKAREEFGPAAHVKQYAVAPEEFVHSVGIFDLMGYRMLGVGTSWEQAFEEARKK